MKRVYLPTAWQQATIGEVADIRSGYGFPKIYQGRSEGDYPFAKVGDISEAVRAGKSKIAAASNYVDEADLKLLKAKPLPAKTIVFAKIGEALRLNYRAMTELPLLVDNNVMGLVSFDEAIEPCFLFLYMKTVDLSSIAVATAVPSVRKTEMEKVTIPLPPLNEQKRIVAKIEALQERSGRVKEELEAIRPLLEQFRRSVLAAAFRGDLTKDWRTNRDVSCAKPVSLSEILSEIKTGPFGTVLHKSDYISGGIPVINPMHINDGKITHSFEITVSPKKAEKLSDFMLHAKDVIIGRRGVMGRCAVVQLEHEGWLCGTGSMILRVRSEVLPKYLQLFLSSPIAIEGLESAAVGSTMANLNQRVLLSLRLLQPTPQEQTEIVRRVESLFKLADAIEKQYQEAESQLETLKQSILAKAFRGELVPQDPNDESASVLLERIRKEREVGTKEPKKSKAKKTAKKPPSDCIENSSKRNPEINPIQLNIPGID